MVPDATIGWFPRERFAVAAESLQTLLENSPSCRLIIVDPDTPPRYMDEIRSVLGDRPAEIISMGRPTLPSTAKNLILERVDTEYVALVENDVLFGPQWLERLIRACEEFPADVASPLILDGRGDREHFDKHLGRIQECAKHPGKYEVLPIAEPRNSATVRTQVDFVEQHCLVFRSSVFERIGSYRDLNTRDEVDLSLALWDAGCTIVLEPDVQIHYVPPKSRPADDELPFYLHRWDLEHARLSREKIQDQWNLVATPGDLEFVRYRNLIAQGPEVRRSLVELAQRSGTTVLLDNGHWMGSDLTEGLESLSPFPDLAGHFGGFPASDEEAVAELQRAIRDGAARIVIGYPAFWWLDHLPGLAACLEGACHVVRDDDLVRVFEVAG